MGGGTVFVDPITADDINIVDTVLGRKLLSVRVCGLLCEGCVLHSRTHVSDQRVSALTMHVHDSTFTMQTGNPARSLLAEGASKTMGLPGNTRYIILSTGLKEDRSKPVGRGSG
jgi:hypothetical protein